MKSRLSIHLWTGGEEAPWEWVELNLCRLYHCAPEEVRRIDAWTVLAHLACLEIESKLKDRRIK